MPHPVPEPIIAKGLNEAVALGLVSSWDSARSEGETLASSPRRYRITWAGGSTIEVGAGFAYAYGLGVHDVLEELRWPVNL